jgi:hypothetical protein|nr:MAG TPA: hypothetical protein [Caudoviricetes sp.]
MAIVKNRFDLRLLNHLVEKTGGANEAINHYAQLVGPATLGLIYCEKFPMNDLGDDELLMMIEIASTLSYFEAFKEYDIFLTGEMMDWYLYWYHRMMKTYSDGDFGRLLGLKDYTVKLFKYVEYIHAESLVGYYREAKVLTLNKWTRDLEAEWIRRNK